MSKMRLLGIGVLLAWLSATESGATVVSGQVTNGLGQGIASVNLDYIDLATGINIPLVNGGTDILGFYSIDVPVGTYDIRYKPTRGDRYPAKIVGPVIVSGASMVIDERLDDAFMVTGRVLDSMGVPLVDADMDVLDPLTGVKLFIANDKTDALGNFLVALAPDVYDIVVEPPPGARLITRVFSMESVAADLPLGDITLSDGWLVSGRVRDSAAGPVLDADLDAIDPVTGEKLRISHDKTDAAGRFSIVVSPGTWDIDIAPPPGSRLLSQRVLGVSVPPDADLGVIVLESGFIVTGRVIDRMGVPATGVDIDAVDIVTGESFPLSGDTTDALGLFSVGVPAGTWRFDFEPPAGSRLIARRILDVVIAADTPLGDVVLDSGFLLSGRVVDAGGAPIFNANLDVIDELTGMKLALANDASNLLGLFEIAVPAGTFRLDVQAPPGSRLQAKSVTGLVVTDDTALGDIVLAAGWLLSGRVVDGLLQPIPGVNLDLIDESTGVDLPLGNDLSGADGRFEVAVADGLFTLQLKPMAAGPHAPSQLQGIDVTADRDLGDITLALGFSLRGRAVDLAGQPVAAADIDLLESMTGTAVFLVGDVSGVDGIFALKAPAGLHDVLVIPPPGSGLLSTTVIDVAIDPAVDLGDVVLLAGALLSGSVEAPAGTPLPGVLVSQVDPLTLLPAGPSDLSDGLGVFALPVEANGNVALWYDAPAGSPWLSRGLSGIAARLDRVLPPVVLERGAVVTGLVTDGGGAPVADALLRIVETSSGRLAGSTSTVADGSYAFTVAVGMFDVLADAPVASGMASAALSAELIAADRVLPTLVLELSFDLQARLVDGVAAGVEGVSVTVRPSGGGPVVPTPAVLSAATGSLTVPVASGTWDLVFTPPELSGFGALAVDAVFVSAAVDLGDLLLPIASVPVLVSMTPTAGSTQGGTAVTLRGDGFELGVEAFVGGVELTDLILVDTATLTAVTGPRPAGVVDVEVRNPGADVRTLFAVFTYVQADPDVVLRVDESGPLFTDTLLTWTDNGQPSWRVFRSASPSRFGDADSLATVGALEHRDTQAAGLPGVHYFLVE